MFKLKSQFFQSFIIIFFVTVISNILYSQGSILFNTVKESFNTKDITPEVASSIQEVIYNQITNDISEPVAVFFYQNDYSSRIKFESNSLVSSPVINDVKGDPEYLRMLEYHSHHICYQQSIKQMDKTSSLYIAYKELEDTSEYPGYYTSCPILINDILIGYIGSFYNLDTPSRPSLRVSRLTYLSRVMSELLDPYF